mgnify:CR=1 FL=1
MGNKRGFFGSLASAFVEDVPEGEAEQAVAEATPQQARTAVISPPVVGMPTAFIGAANPEMVKTLREGLKNAGASAYNTVFGFLEAVPDDLPLETRLRTAMKIASKQGIDAAAVLGDFGRLEACIKAQENAFAADVKVQRAQAVGGRADAAKHLRESAATKRAEIERLQREAGDELAQASQLEGEMQSQENHITGVEASFAASATALRTELRQQQELITRSTNGGR